MTPPKIKINKTYYNDLSGMRKGFLTVLRLAEKPDHLSKNDRQKYWECMCDCGNTCVYSSGTLRNNKKVTACGCRQGALYRGTSKKVLHKGAYSSWYSMKQRCTNTKNDSYAYYGGRGINFEARWNHFDNFLEDMGDRPDGFSIDRIDPNKGYSKLNCRWADSKTQAENKRTQ